MILLRIFEIFFIAFLVGGYGILVLYSFWLALQDSIAGGRQAHKDRCPTVDAKREATTWWLSSD